VGSIAAGGRYDNLVGMFASAGTVVPCVGVSIGIERVFAIMEARQSAAGGLKRTPVSVMVASIPSTKGLDMAAERMAMCARLWAAGLSAEMVYAADPKLQKQMTTALEAGVPYMVVLGEDELSRGEVQVKDMVARAATIVRKEDVVAALLGMGARPVGAAGNAAAPLPADAGASSAAGSAGGSGGAVAQPEPAVAAPQAAGGSIGVVPEGSDRPYGHFMRPAQGI
jgi:hypothetical protein